MTPIVEQRFFGGTPPWYHPPNRLSLIATRITCEISWLLSSLWPVRLEWVIFLGGRVGRMRFSKDENCWRGSAPQHVRYLIWSWKIVSRALLKVDRAVVRDFRQFVCTSYLLCDRNLWYWHCSPIFTSFSPCDGQFLVIPMICEMLLSSFSFVCLSLLFEFYFAARLKRTLLLLLAALLLLCQNLPHQLDPPLTVVPSSMHPSWDPPPPHGNVCLPLSHCPCAQSLGAASTRDCQ